MSVVVDGLAARSTAREVARLRRRFAVRHAAGRALLYVVAVVAALICALPFLCGVVTAFTRDPDPGGRGDGPFSPTRPPASRYGSFLFESTLFPTFVVNTLLVGSIVVAVTLALALPAAYALVRLRGTWRSTVGVAILLVYLVPPALLFVSLSRIVVALGLRDSIWSLVLVYPTITIPVSVWLLVGFLRAVPADVEEQAMVDGHSRAGAFVRVVVPLVLPGIAAAAVFAFTLAAGEFAYAVTFVSSASRTVIGAGVATREAGGAALGRSSVHAAIVVTAVPIAFVVNLLLDRVIECCTPRSRRDDAPPEVIVPGHRA